MQTLRTQLQIARLVLMKSRVKESLAQRDKPSPKVFDAATALQVIDFIRALDLLPNAIDGEPTALRTH